jgi:hypothetical protein
MARPAASRTVGTIDPTSAVVSSRNRRTTSPTTTRTADTITAHTQSIDARYSSTLIVLR